MWRQFFPFLELAVEPAADINRLLIIVSLNDILVHLARLDLVIVPGQYFVAKRYDDEDILHEELESLPKTLTYKILELQRCPKCKKEFTEHPALSRVDNETEICPECGVIEAIEAYQKATWKQGGFFLTQIQVGVLELRPVSLRRFPYRYT